MSTSNESLNEYAATACINGEPHNFDNLHVQDTYKRRDMAAWAWCTKCGSTIEIYAEQNAPAIITRPMVLQK